MIVIEITAVTVCTSVWACARGEIACTHVCICECKRAHASFHGVRVRVSTPSGRACIPLPHPLLEINRIILGNNQPLFRSISNHRRKWPMAPILTDIYPDNLISVACSLSSLINYRRPCLQLLSAVIRPRESAF